LLSGSLVPQRREVGVLAQIQVGAIGPVAEDRQQKMPNRRHEISHDSHTVSYATGLRRDRGSVSVHAMARLGLLAEFWYFICHRKTWWMVPLLLALALIGALAVFGEASVLAPFLYPLF
jgi:hypothetical protein